MVHSQSNPFLFPFAPWLDIQRSIGDGVLQTLKNGTQSAPTRGHLYHDEEGATWVAQVAGLKAEDLELTVDGRTVLLSMTPKAEGEGEGEERAERFEQKLRMSFDIDGDAAQASLVHGLLLVRLPKRQAPQGKRIPISG